MIAGNPGATFCGNVKQKTVETVLSIVTTLITGLQPR